MNRLDLIKMLLTENSETKTESQESNESFLEIGKPYLIRTVTMIYTGRLKALNKQELLITEAAWIPETERWMNTVTKSVFREVEPYGDKPVVIGRSAILDVVEIDKLPKEQK